MRKILWAIVVLSAYIWAVTSGNDRMIIDQVKKGYSRLAAWFDEAEVDFQWKPNKTKQKKKNRRWD